MSKNDCFIKDTKSGQFMGSKPGCSGKAGVDPKKGVVKVKRKEVNYGEEFAKPNNYQGNLTKRHEEMFKLTREKLAEGGRTFPDKDVAKHIGDDYWTGQASEYEADEKAKTATGESYGDNPDAVAINRIFSYKKNPTIRNKFVVVGDMGKEDGKIEIRKVNDTGMYASYIDKNGLRQKYPHPTNIVDFHKGSLDNFCGKPNCGRQPIMMRTCESIGECRIVQKEMKEKIRKWREENVKKK
ncbi:MAG: hypothetical protein HQL01_05770 [Nitrospirae bacterium]|nr:hypothetical protein [Nitrospirota bacterium]